MEVFEKINSLLQYRNLNKREFAKKLRDLEPKLNRTGEMPSEKTIYKYLDGSIAIKIELIPYIAEVLHITEQELFTNDEKSRKKFFQNLIKTASEEELNILQTKYNLKLDEIPKVKEPKTNYRKTDSLEEELIALLPFAPNPLLQNFVNKLKELRDFNDSI